MGCKAQGCNRGEGQEHTESRGVSLWEDPLGFRRCESRERLRNERDGKLFHHNCRGKEVGKILESCFIK